MTTRLATIEAAGRRRVAAVLGSGEALDGPSPPVSAARGPGAAPVIVPDARVLDLRASSEARP